MVSKCVASMCRKQKVAVMRHFDWQLPLKQRKNKKKRTTRKERKKGLTI